MGTNLPWLSFMDMKVLHDRREIGHHFIYIIGVVHLPTETTIHTHIHTHSHTHTHMSYTQFLYNLAKNPFISKMLLEK